MQEWVTATAMVIRASVPTTRPACLNAIGTANIPDPIDPFK